MDSTVKMEVGCTYLLAIHFHLQPMIWKRISLLLVVVVSLAALGVGSYLLLRQPTAAPKNTSSFSVVSTVYPLDFFARSLAHDAQLSDTTFTLLTPQGVEPHDFEPSARDLTVLQSADLVLINGGGIDGWIDRSLSDLPPTTQILRLSDLPSIAPLLINEEEVHAHHEAEEGETHDAHEEEEAFDEHIWLDPVLAQAVVDAIGAALPANTHTNDRHLSLKTALKDLDLRYKKGLSSCQKEDLFVSHASMGYLAKRYGFHQHPISGLSPHAEPSPARIAELIKEAKAQQIEYVFFETLTSPKLAEVLAKQIGAKTLLFHPIEGLTDKEREAGETYLTLMEKNLENLKRALVCQP